MNRLLIQPTVQEKWLLQHGAIEFELPAELQQRFLALWQRYLNSGLALPEFLESAAVQALALFDDDWLFALLTGAAYLQARHPHFKIERLPTNLRWQL